MTKKKTTISSLDGLDALFAERFFGAVNIRGIRYQVLYSLKVALDAIRSEESASVHLEGIEDVDLQGMSIGKLYIQAKTSDVIWNLAKLKEPLKNFLEVLRHDSSAQFQLVVNFDLPTTHDIGKLAQRLSLKESEKKKILSKIEPYLREIGASSSEGQQLLAAMTIKHVPSESIWDDIRISLVQMFALGSEAVDIYGRVFVEKFLEWAENRQIVTRLELNKVRDEVGQTLSRESEYQAYGRGLIDRLEWHLDGNKDDYYEGKQTRPSHIVSDADVKRERWLLNISEIFLSHKVCVIKSSSGQGKSSLAFRYAYENWKHLSVFLLRSAHSEEDAEKVVNFLQFQRKLGFVPFLIIDNANMQKKHWSRVAQACTGLGGQVLVTVRMEDWVRFSEPSMFKYSIVEPVLSLDEAKEIWQAFRKEKRLHPTMQSHEHAYELLMQPKLLMEYVYLLTHGQMLAERLREQVRQFSTADDEPTKATILRRVTLASVSGISLRLESLLAGLHLRQDLQLVFDSLKDEYLFMNGSDVGGLHWVRSMHLVKLLHNEYLNAARTAIDLLGIVPPEDIAKLIAGLCDVPEFDWENFQNAIIQNYRNASLVTVLFILDGLFQAGERLFFERNREHFERYIQNYGLAAQMFLTGYCSSVELDGIRERTRAAMMTVNPVAWEALDAMGRALNHEVRGLALCRRFLSHVTPPPSWQLLRDLRDIGLIYDWCRAANVDVSSWPSLNNEVFKNDSPLLDTPLDAFSLFLQGYSAFHRDNYTDWLSNNREAIQSYLRFRTNSVQLETNESEVSLRYIPDLETKQTLNEQTMTRLNAARSALPFLSTYRGQALWTLPSGLSPTTDESVKAIPRENLPLATDNQKNAVLPRIIDLAYRPDSHYVFQQRWHQYRSKAVRAAEELLNFIIDILKGSLPPEQIVLRISSLTPLLQELLRDSHFLPALPRESSSNTEKRLNQFRNWEGSLFASLRQLIQAVGNSDTDARRLGRINSLKVIDILPEVHAGFDELYRITSDYFDGNALKATERRVYKDWVAAWDAYSSFDGNPIRNIRHHLDTQEEVRRRDEQDALHAVLAMAETHGVRFVYPRDSLRIEFLRYMPIGIHVSNPNEIFGDEVKVTLAALAQATEFMHFYWLIPIFNGARCIKGGIRISSGTIHDLSEGETVPWETLMPTEPPPEILSLLGDIPLHVPFAVEAENAVSALRAELETVQIHLNTIVPLSVSEQKTDRDLHAQHVELLKSRYQKLSAARETVFDKYRDFAEQLAVKWAEISSLQKSLSAVMG